MKITFSLIVLYFLLAYDCLGQVAFSATCSELSVVHDLQDLDGFSAEMLQDSEASAIPFCTMEGEVDGPSWLAFRVDPYFSYSVTVAFTDCNSTQPINGGQLGIYNACDDWSSPIFCEVETINGSYTFPSDIIFDPEETYYLMIDGVAGSICKVTFSVGKYMPMSAITDWYHYSGGFGGGSTYWYNDIGDTIINNLEYRIIGTSTNSLITYFMREDVNTRKVYSFNNFSNQESLLYDFSASIGDLIELNVGTFEVVNIDMVEGVYGELKRWTLDGPGPAIRVIEGIGSADLFLANTASDPVFGLLCAYNQSDKIFGNDDCAPSPRWPVELDVTICEGDSYSLGGTIYSNSGVYIDTLINQVGLDSVVQLTLEVLPIIESNYILSLCEGESLIIDGTIFDESNPIGTIILPGADINQCDSIINVSVFFMANIINNIEVSVCEGDSLILGGVTYTESGNYFTNHISVLGCDSIVSLDLEFLPAQFSMDSLFICYGDSVLVSGDLVFEEGVYEVPFQDVNGCDSTHNTIVSFLPDSDCISDTKDLQDVTIELHPNPFSHFIYVSSESQIEDISIVNSQGVRIANITGIDVNHYSLNCSQWSSGVYIFVIKSNSGVFTKRVVKY